MPNAYFYTQHAHVLYTTCTYTISQARIVKRIVNIYTIDFLPQFLYMSAIIHFGLKGVVRARYDESSTFIAAWHFIHIAPAARCIECSHRIMHYIIGRYTHITYIIREYYSYTIALTRIAHNTLATHITLHPTKLNT